jgi:uncharacterized repeat protein (TIGR03803 family)
MKQRVFVSLLALSAIAAHRADAAWKQTTIFTFTGASTGTQPQAGLIFDAKGNLYGTASAGGNSNAGVVFKLTPPAKAGAPWTQTIIYAFAPSGKTKDAAVPFSALVFDKAGNLYGTTYFGLDGTNGCGTIFKLAPPATPTGAWTESVLYAWAPCGIGATPVQPSGLAIDNAGNLYGTIKQNTASGPGLAFRLSPPTKPGGTWAYKPLAAFSNAKTGTSPIGGVVGDVAGNLYGVTQTGGNSHGDGLVYRLAPPTSATGAWSETVLLQFGGLDGDYPLSGLTLDSSGNIFGTTGNGGTAQNGNVFKLSKPASGKTVWPETVLFGAFTSATGLYPASPPVFDKAGDIYAIAGNGGSATCKYGCGTAFRLAPPAAGASGWTLGVISSFTKAKGGYPTGSLVLDAAGNVYGTTSAGGADKQGTVFELTP